MDDYGSEQMHAYARLRVHAYEITQAPHLQCMLSIRGMQDGTPTDRPYTELSKNVVIFFKIKGPENCCALYTICNARAHARGIA